MKSRGEKKYNFFLFYEFIACERAPNLKIKHEDIAEIFVVAHDTDKCGHTPYNCWTGILTKQDVLNELIESQNL